MFPSGVVRRSEERRRQRSRWAFFSGLLNHVLYPKPFQFVVNKPIEVVLLLLSQRSEHDAEAAEQRVAVNVRGRPFDNGLEVE